MMIDSLLTLTKRGVFWLVLLFVIAVAMSFMVSAIVGQQEPMFLLFALAIAALLIVASVYTLGKKLVWHFRHPAEKPPES